MKPISFMLLAFVLLSFQAESQNTEIQAGIRSGTSNGLSCRVLTGFDTFTEAMLLSRHGGTQLYLLMGHNKPLDLFGFHQLTFSTAWGGHLGYTGNESYYHPVIIDRSTPRPVLGADFYAGINYQISRFPLMISADYKPFAELVPGKIMRINLWDFALTLRYTFTINI